jgi:diketogulonate reductase-like aldo/keto reductase
MSLRRITLQRIDLFQLHRIDPIVALEDREGELACLQQEDKFRFVGLSEVSVGQLTEAQRNVRVGSVQSRYHLRDRTSDPLSGHCPSHGIAFSPWHPLANGNLAEHEGVLAKVAIRLEATAAQVIPTLPPGCAPNVLSIRGTSSLRHTEEDPAAAQLEIRYVERKELELSC